MHTTTQASKPTPVIQLDAARRGYAMAVQSGNKRELALQAKRLRRLSKTL